MIRKDKRYQILIQARNGHLTDERSYLKDAMIKDER